VKSCESKVDSNTNCLIAMIVAWWNAGESVQIFCQVDFTRLPSPLFQIPKSTWPCLDSQVTNSTLPNCQVHFDQWTAWIGLKLPETFKKKELSNPCRVCPNCCLTNSDCPWFILQMLLHMPFIKNDTKKTWNWKLKSFESALTMVKN
jgi:hypothetical protein